MNNIPAVVLGDEGPDFEKESYEEKRERDMAEFVKKTSPGNLMRHLTGEDPGYTPERGKRFDTPSISVSEMDKKESAVAGLVVELADKIKGCQPDVHKKLVDLLTDREIDKRVSSLDQAYQKLHTLETEMKKLDKPDIETFDADNKPLPGTFSKGAKEKRVKHREKVNKLKGAIERCLSTEPGDKKAEFKKLDETMKKV